MKLLLDFLPIVLFFVVFKTAQGRPDEAAAFATEHFGALVAGGSVGPAQAPVLLATLVVILATVAQVLFLKLRGQRVENMVWFSLVLVVVFGGATIWFQNETFIKWKPSILYWAMGLVFWLSQAIWGKNLLKAAMGQQISLPGPAWQQLNLMWIGFFAFMGLANLYVAYSFSTEAWVNFKLFGGLGFMLVFLLLQGVFLSRHAEKPAEDAGRPS